MPDINSSGSSGNPTSSTRTHLSSAEDTLTSLAVETGGRAFLHGIRASKIVRHIRDDLGCVYLLSFHPGDLPQLEAGVMDTPNTVTSGRWLASREERGVVLGRGLAAALERKKRALPPVAKLLDGRQEARLIARSCSSPPEGRARWTLRLLADELVVLEVVEAISHETVRQTLKKTN